MPLALLMSYCVFPECQKPENSAKSNFCVSCGSRLLLRERYSSLKPIGRGGFGRAFLAVDEDIPSKPRCVIKQFYFQGQKPEQVNIAVRLFHKEAERLNELGEHPQIPTLLAKFEQEGRLYLVQEFIDGNTLEQELNQGAFDESQVWELLRDLLPVLQFIHDRRVIHRDIKLNNIIRRSSDRKPVLIDFGIAKLLTDSAQLETGTAIGSKQYIAPEQLYGKARYASDLYSLGVTCIQLMTKVCPPRRMYHPSEQKWWWRQYLPPGRNVSDRLGQILDKLLEANLTQRYPFAKEVLADLNATQQANPYTRLHNLLAQQEWREADQETWSVMCQVLGKSPGTTLEYSALKQFPLKDLQVIDQLWVRYSQGHFGFSIQKQIYESVDEDYVSFCDRVGWLSYRPYTPYQGMNFSLQAPRGHLPSRIWAGGTQWWRHAAIMASRL